MKNLLTLTITTATLISLSACSSKDLPSPSQNEVLNSVSVSTAAKDNGGTMQSSLDTWLKDEWIPTIEKSERIKEIEKDKDRDFTLQEYVDKAEIYHQEKEPSNVESHVEKVNQMPVIGKEKSFNLQEYVDSAKINEDDKSDSNKESHATKINTLPVIGK